MERSEILRLARSWAEVDMQDDLLTNAVASFVTICAREKLDPPLHHATVTQGVLLANSGDTEGVRKWIGEHQ